MISDVTKALLSPPRVGLGCMRLSIGGRPDWAEAKKVIRTAVEGGVNHLDTADVYALDDSDIGCNERLIGETLREMGIGLGNPCPAVIVATKGGRRRPDGAWTCDGRPSHLRRACEASLVALGLETLPLYYLHAVDPGIPLEESVGALDELRGEGKILALGLSNVGLKEIRRAEAVARIDAVQNQLTPWGVGGRPSPVVRHCEKKGMIFAAHTPLGGREGVARLRSSAEFDELAARVGADAAQLAIKALQMESPVVLPIPGATSVTSASSTAAAASVELTVEDQEQLRRAVRRLPGRASALRRILGRVRRAFG